MAAKKKAAKKRAPLIGRPSSFRPEMQRIARQLCRLGATDKDLAAAFDVTEQTINNWKDKHPAFFESLKEAKREADERVERSLFERAIGYEHDAVKILTVARGENQGSEVQEVPYTERYAPDTTAAIFWLKNRRPELWRDKQTVEHDVTEGLADALRAARERAANR